MKSKVNNIPARLNDSVLCITGGTGSFGHEIMSFFLDSNIKEIRIISRDEKKQDDMRKRFLSEKLKFFIGDVRDKDRLHRALHKVDYVVHAAATKIVPTAEYNPFECIKTNINGAMNLIDASIDHYKKKLRAFEGPKVVKTF